MNRKPMLISVRLDARSFRVFAIFDTFKRQKRWISPMIFSFILLASSVFCFSRQGDTQNAALLGCVLLLIALGLPAVYFYSFFTSIRQQIQKMHLEKPVHVYSVELSGQRGVGFYPKDAKKAAEYHSWETIYMAYRTKDAVYLYLTPGRALLMPDGLCGHTLDDIWNLLSELLPEEKLRCRSGKFIK